MPKGSGKLVVAVTLAVYVAVAGTVATAGAQGARGSSRDGWRLPPNAATELSPLKVTDAVLGAGRKLYLSKCRRCHGPQGKGDGPDAEKKHQQDMVLTVAARAADNPDGVVFHKIWNGRTEPKMPVFSEELSREQAWAIVAYVQSLRAK